MTNLIPRSAKKKIVQEYWMRVVCAWVVLWSLCILVGVVLLWPTYVLLSGNNAAYAEFFSDASERSAEFEASGQQLVEATRQSIDIIRLSEQATLSSVLADIWSTVDASTIVIEDIDITRSEVQETLNPIGITGEASNRQALADFRSSLQALPYVTAVDLPIENLAQNEDIAFTMTVTIALETP